MAATVNEFYADVSKWNGKVVNSLYPHPLFAFRAHSGFATDPDAAANWAYVQKAKTIQAAIAYVVFIPGNTTTILSDIKTLFGAKAPAKLAVMVDMESGTGFAGPGDHSAEANGFVQELAVWLGSEKRVIGYANRSDWASNWPTRPGWLKQITAAYGTTDPGTWGWQYYGGTSANPSPAGYPTSCLPFGNCDMNVIHKPIGEILDDLGLDWLSMASEAQTKAAFLEVLQSPAGQAAITKACVAADPMPHFNQDPATGSRANMRGWLTPALRALSTEITGKPSKLTFTVKK